MQRTCPLLPHEYCLIMYVMYVIYVTCLFTCFQDFELWDDVGLNIPKPPDLLQLYRNCGTPLPSPRDTVDVSVGVDFGDLPGNCNAQDPPKKPDLSQQVCVSVCMHFYGCNSLMYSSSRAAPCILFAVTLFKNVFAWFKVVYWTGKRWNQCIYTLFEVKVHCFHHSRVVEAVYRTAMMMVKMKKWFATSTFTLCQ